ncbi:hypothetical protein MSAN_00537400 [Mycena sanguinolenta]|uniref:Uncharacterized protein n=1 Tax=Mycena sanguinolenta TaxID=230812 RepID=A0A8H7DF87_9AGAR|nr:hypothetical protein MSAN_00537400 [Mycena sanguinolenta]
MAAPEDKGGRGGKKGGNGGIGERPHISRDDIHRFSGIHGGTGGVGGEGGDDGGDGGAGQGPNISTELLPAEELASVPDMAIDDFCKEYGVRDTSRDLLKKDGFDTVGGRFGGFQRRSEGYRPQVWGDCAVEEGAETISGKGQKSVAQHYT